MKEKIPPKGPPIPLSPGVQAALGHYADTLGKAKVSPPDIDKALRRVAEDPRKIDHFIKTIDAIVNPPPNGSFLPPNFPPKE